MCQCRWQNFEKKNRFTSAGGHLVKPVPVPAFFFGTGAGDQSGILYIYYKSLFYLQQTSYEFSDILLGSIQSILFFI
jgi:hypothetical protein